MSQEHVKLAHDAFAAYNSGRIDAMLKYFDPNVELVAPAEWPDNRVERGHPGLRWILADLEEQFDRDRRGASSAAKREEVKAICTPHSMLSGA